MLFGDIQSFAIECTLDQNYGGEWLFGKVCYWIGGQRIGNYDLGTSLRDVLFQMKYIMHYCAKRQCSTLCNMDSKDAFMLIDNALYGGYDIGNNQAWRNVEFLAFNIKIPVDVFDEWKIYLIECDHNDRAIYKEENHINPIERLLNHGYFDMVVAEFYKYLDNLYEKEVAVG